MNEFRLWSSLLFVCNLICFILIMGLYNYKITNQGIWIIAFLQFIFLLTQLRFGMMVKQNETD